MAARVLTSMPCARKAVSDQFADPVVTLSPGGCHDGVPLHRHLERFRVL